jgi:tetratricopeptide (TPR) repeat protein
VYNLHNYAQFLLTSRHDHRGAKKLLDKALAIQPNDPDCLSLSAMLMWEYDEDQPFDEVEEILKRVYQFNPRHLANLSRLALFYKQVRGDKAQAEELEKKLVRLKQKRSSKKKQK